MLLIFVILLFILSMTYQQLWDQLDLLLKDYGTKKKKMEELQNIMAERIEIEQNYSRAMQRQAERLNTLYSQGTLVHTVQGLRKDFQMRADQADRLAIDIKENIHDGIKDFLKQQTTLYSNIQQEVKALHKDLARHHQAMDRSRETFNDKYLQLDKSLLQKECLGEQLDLKQSQKHERLISAA